LCRELAGKNYSVVGVSRHPDKARAVVNLAGDNIGRGRWTRRKKERILKSRLDAGRAVTEAILHARSKPAVVLQASAVGAYGDRADESLDEYAAPGQGFLSDLTQLWEISTRATEGFGIRLIVVRSAVVLGRAGGALPTFERMFRLRPAGIPGGGRQWFPWIHLMDEVRAMVFLLGRDDLSGVFNLAAPSAVPMAGFIRASKSVRRRRPRVLIRRGSL
jgi:uncharacterized protein (TIGR01777 family)